MKKQIVIGNAKTKKTLPLGIWLYRLHGPMVRGYEVGFRLGDFIVETYFTNVRG